MIMFFEFLTCTYMYSFLIKENKCNKKKHFIVAFLSISPFY